jgi:hypothetical protein
VRIRILSDVPIVQGTRRQGSVWPLQRLTAALALLTIVACVYSPGLSTRDERFFSERPYIAAKTGGYALNWRYGSLGCVFFPEGKVVDGELQFRLPATTSTGCIPRREASMPITKPEEVRALESKGAYWLEPDGSRLKLDIRFQ